MSHPHEPVNVRLAAPWADPRGVAGGGWATALPILSRAPCHRAWFDSDANWPRWTRML